MHHSRCNSPHTDLMLGQLFRPHLRVCGQKGGGRRRAGDRGVGGIGVGVSLCLCFVGVSLWVPVYVCGVGGCRGCQFEFVVWVSVCVCVCCCIRVRVCVRRAR